MSRPPAAAPLPHGLPRLCVTERNAAERGHRLSSMHTGGCEPRLRHLAGISRWPGRRGQRARCAHDLGVPSSTLRYWCDADITSSGRPLRRTSARASSRKGGSSFLRLLETRIGDRRMACQRERERPNLTANASSARRTGPRLIGTSSKPGWSRRRGGPVSSRPPHSTRSATPSARTSRCGAPAKAIQSWQARSR
jgi:hypothetical protein